MKNRKSIGILDRIRKNVKRKTWECFHPECNENAINSHLLQKNGIIDLIAEEQHIIETTSDLFKKDQISFKKLGYKQGFSFKGFCRKHDSDIFYPIEKENKDFFDYDNQLLLSYRSILNERRKKDINIEWYDRVLKSTSLEGKVDINGLKRTLQFEKEGREDQEFYITEMEKSIFRGSEKRMFNFFFRKIPKIPFCASAVYTFETIEEIRELITNTEKTSDSQLSILFCNLIPQEEYNLFIAGYHLNDEVKCKNYLEEIFEKNETDFIKKMSDMILINFESWACSPSFYLKKIKNKERALIKFMRETIHSSDRDTFIDFNLFDS